MQSLEEKNSDIFPVSILNEANPLQEPASLLLSVLNLLAHAYGLLSLRRTVARFPLVEGRAAYPYTGLWHLYALFNINAWLWSAVFHAR